MVGLLWRLGEIIYTECPRHEVGFYKHLFLFQNILEFSQSTKFMQVFIKGSICSNLNQILCQKHAPPLRDHYRSLPTYSPVRTQAHMARKGQRQGFSSELLTALTRLQARSRAGSNSSTPGRGGEGGGKVKEGAVWHVPAQAAASRVSSWCLLCTNG